MKKCCLLITLLMLFCTVCSSCGTSQDTAPSYSAVHTMGGGDSATDSDDVTSLAGEAVQPGDSSGGSGSYGGSGNSSGGSGNSSGGSAGGSQSSGSSASTTSKYIKSGTVSFSDSADNVYISAVVSAYGDDPALLAAIYTVPHGDDNTVLCFDGTLGSDGAPVKTADTLKYIYTVDASYGIKRASETAAECVGYSAAESRVMFYSVRHYLIPKFESELG